MVKVSQLFYESTYTEEHKKPKSQRFIVKLYILLKNFENYREDVVFDLMPKGQRFLDIGCGNGSLVIKALKKFKFAYGIDIARTRLSFAYENIKKLPPTDKKRIKFEIGDVDDKLTYKNEFFDTITMVATFEHFFDPYHVMNECKRILKKGGTIIIQVPNLGFLPRRLSVLIGSIPITSEDEYGWDGGHLHYFTVTTLKDLLEKNNFIVKKVTCSGVFAPLRSIWVELLGGDIIISAQKI